MTRTSHEPRRYRLRHRRRPLDAWVAGDGPPVVLLHGWGLSGGAYRPVLRALAAKGRRAIGPTVAAIDVPWTLGGVAERVAELMVALDAVPAAVVGHSFGGVVGLRVANDHGGFVSALVAVNSPLVSPNRRGLGRLALPGRHYRVAAHAGTAFALGQTLFKPGGISSLAAAARFVLVGDLSDELRAVREQKIPSAVVWAEADSLLPATLGRQAADALGCELELVGSDGGWPLRQPPDHDWPMRAPRTFAERIVKVLDRLERPSSDREETG